MPVRFDDSLCPLMSVRFEAPMTDDDVDEYHRQLASALERAKREGRKYAWAMDAGSSQGTTARQRKMFADFVNQHRRLIQQASLGTAIVQRSAVQRGVLTALLWLFKPPVPIRPFATIEEAREWARNEIAAFERSAAGRQATPPE